MARLQNFIALIEMDPDLLCTNPLTRGQLKFHNAHTFLRLSYCLKVHNAHLQLFELA